jgi:hypothetical protein
MLSALAHFDTATICGATERAHCPLSADEGDDENPRVDHCAHELSRGFNISGDLIFAESRVHFGQTISKAHVIAIRCSAVDAIPNGT